MDEYPKVISDKKLGKELILNELFDLTLYQQLRLRASSDFLPLLDELIIIERRHLLFWEGCFGLKDIKLDTGRRLKLWTMLFLGKITNGRVLHMMLKANEIFGIRRYLAVWEVHKDTELGKHISAILRDELVHEDWIDSRYKTWSMSPERVRSMFLGFNDGSVEILGAVSGFFIVFNDPRSVLIAGSTVAIAGAISMAAGAFASSSSENEVRAIEDGKARFLLQIQDSDTAAREPAVALATLVGGCYLVGSLVPLLPIVLGSQNAFFSIVVSCVAILLVSYALAFLSGMNARRRMLMNLFVICAAVSITSGIGYLVRITLGVIV